MRLKNPGELNKFYNFQDTTILCEIFEQWSKSFLNSIQENVILQAVLVAVFMIKVST